LWSVIPRKTRWFPILDANRWARSALSKATHELRISKESGKFSPSFFRFCLPWLFLKLMFVGHYSVSFAAKSERNRIPLWVLFIAVQFLDYIWATLVLLGIEKLRVIKGFTAGSMIDSYHHPYSHSLITALIWSAVAAVIYKSVWRAKASSAAALLVGLAVFSHWILDFIAHPRDLPIYDNMWKVGLGFWNYRGPEFALEVALLAGGIVLYLARNAISAARKKAVIGFGLALIIVQIGDTFVPRTPLSDRATAMGVWVFYTLFVVVAYLLERGAPARISNPDPWSRR
jgi:hypothetical protein